MRDFNEEQARMFIGLSRSVLEHRPLDLQPLVDDDVADAAGALAATLETSSRGVFYEHRPATAPAARLAGALRPLVMEAGRPSSRSEREAAVVLRRIEQSVRETQAEHPGASRAYLDRLRRVLIERAADGQAAESEGSRLILP
jgi:hypothetical protein